MLFMQKERNMSEYIDFIAYQDDAMMLWFWFEKQNDPKWPWPEMTHFHGKWNLFYARLDDN